VNFSYNIVSTALFTYLRIDFAYFIIFNNLYNTSWESRYQWYMTIHWLPRCSECRITEKENNKYKKLVYLGHQGKPRFSGA
jgi:hypothetical protein